MTPVRKCVIFIVDCLLRLALQMLKERSNVGYRELIERLVRGCVERKESRSREEKGALYVIVVAMPDFRIRR